MNARLFVEPQNLEVLNPKRHQDKRTGEDKKIFPYYAGYSFAFADSLLHSMALPPGALVLDPWNGSGTSTLAAAKHSVRAIGVDLNPVMVVVAKASLVSNLDIGSLKPLSKTIVGLARPAARALRGSDPLEQWLVPSSAAVLRGIFNQVCANLLDSDGHVSERDYISVARAATPLASFFLVALFRTARRLLLEFIPSNPTWVKKPASLSRRKIPSTEKINAIFFEEVEHLISALEIREVHLASNPAIELQVGNAEALELRSKSVDVVVTSPPYCTRIDYAVATSIELAVLGCDAAQHDGLRRSLTGTSTVQKLAIEPSVSWGRTCNSFLEKIAAHSSKASRSYYLKNHLQYFHSLSNSIAEVGRVLKANGRAILVVQDSYYKDLLNDVPTIVAEMALQNKLSLERRADFLSERNMVRINSASKKYGSNRPTTESVLVFRPQGVKK